MHPLEVLLHKNVLGTKFYETYMQIMCIV